MNPTPASSVADRVRKHILVAEVSQDELGLKIGLSQPAISRRMTGAMPWRLDELEKLAAALGLPLVELLDGSPLAAPSGSTAAAS